MSRERTIAIVILGFSALIVAVAVLRSPESDQTPAASASISPEESKPLDPEASPPSSVDAEEAAAADEPPVLRPANHGLHQLDGWLQDDGSAFDNVTQRPATIVQFWTFGCINCKNTLPHLRDLYSRWEDDGLEIIGVHAPEFDYEADPAAIDAALGDLSVTWPVALDTERFNFRAWQDQGPNYWPRTYVLDRDGRIRYDKIGEGGYRELAETVEWLIANDTERDPVATGS